MTTCPASDRKAQEGMGRPVCPVCHRTSQAGLPSKGSLRGRRASDLTVPEHAARES